MRTLYDFGLEVQKIREAIDSLEVKGNKNASFVVFAYNKCNEIIRGINDIIEQQRNPLAGQNGENTGEAVHENNTGGGAIDGQQDSGTTS